MQKDNTNARKLSVFTYLIILICVVAITILFVKELNISPGFEEILYQRSKRIKKALEKYPLRTFAQVL